MALLEVDNIDTYYGNIQALQGVSLSVDEGEIVTLIGANGAGKTTTLDTVSGLLKPRQGAVYLEGEPIHNLPPHLVVKKGISGSPEGRKVFRRLTVLENLEMGAYVRTDRARVRRDLEQVFLLFPRLQERVGQAGGTLSGGEQQMLAIGRALMARPRLLLLDEPSMGLAPLLVEDIFRVIGQLNEEGTTILLVEQNALMALSVAQRGYVLETGRVVLEGTADELRENPDVQNAYLGGG